MELETKILNPSAERGILSICMQDIDRIIDCSEKKLFYQHFAVPQNQTIFSVLCYLAEEGVKTIDSNIIYSTVQDETAKKQLDDIGGRAYLDSLLTSTVIKDNLPYYIDQVKECDLRRRLQQFGLDLSKRAETREELEKILSETQSQIFELTEGDKDTEVKQVGKGLAERMMERAKNPTTVLGLSTGWEKFDKITKGLRGNDLVVAIAPSKTGKSFWLCNIAKQLSLIDGLPGLYIDTEMETEEQENRMLAMLAQVPIDEIENGFFSRDTEFGKAEEKINRVMNACKRMEQSKLFHVYMPNFTIESVSSTIRKYYVKEKICYAIFDYIKLPNSDIKGLGVSKEYERLGYFTTCLKDIAGICNIPVVTAGQTNRNDIDTTNPDANNIGGSYRILQMATKLLFLRNKTDAELANEDYAKGNYKVHIKYQRHGSGDEAIDFQFDKPIGRMYEV